MVKSLLFPAVCLSCFGTVAVAAVTANAQIPETSVALCVTDSQAVRAYYRSDRLRLRAYDRQDEVLWMNHTPAVTTTTDAGTAYTNEFGEVTLTLMVMNDGGCSVQIGDNPAEPGTLTEAITGFHPPSGGTLMQDLG